MFNRELKEEIRRLKDLNKLNDSLLSCYKNDYWHSCAKVERLQHESIQLRAEIATLKYQLANPSFGSTETAVVQKARRHALK